MVCDLGVVLNDSFRFAVNKFSFGSLSEIRTDSRYAINNDSLLIFFNFLQFH